MPAISLDWSASSAELLQLLARVGLGDRQAFADMYARTSPHLFGVVLRICNNAAQAEDVLQEVYVNIWHSAASYDAARSQPMTWLTSVARHRTIDTLRRRAAEPRLETGFGHDDGDDSVYDDLADEAPGPLERLSQAADARALSDCVQTLAPQQRQSLALAFYNGLSHSEVAARMDQPLGTVKSWVRRALGALRDCLEGVGSALPRSSVKD